jgi:hypothetical protein
VKYLTLDEAAGLARCAKKTLQNHMAQGVLIEGVHFFRPRGRRPLFDHDAIIAWIEGRDGDMVAAAHRRDAPRCRVNLNGV